MAKAAATVDASLDFAFFHYLWLFYKDKRGAIRQHYKDLTKKFLDFNNPEQNPKAFLRQPQFEALEMYVFLKEYMGNEHVHDIFKAWFSKTGKFSGRKEGGAGDLFDSITEKQYSAVFAKMRKNARVYPNYIYALTMGTGKTILMATCIFYEFLLGNKHDKDPRYCHNALVFAPDKTVLQSLKEIQSLDISKVVPPEYVNFIRSNIRFFYLEEAGTSLDTLDKSRFNIIVSNTQKIILKRQNKSATATDKLFAATKPTYQAGSVYAEMADLLDLDQPEDEADLTTNQRFEKLTRLEQMGIYVDEAHHAFGKALAKDMGLGAKETDTSLRTTIDILASSLERSGTRVVACFNYTGTPYVGREVLPEVVYGYGLQEAIDKRYLKKVQLHGYQNTKSDEFVSIVIDDFLKATEGIRPEGMSPKLAFFGTTIEEIREELKPLVENELAKRGIPASRILVNVGDDKLTTNDDIREFNRLDSVDSDKQFVLLVNKGREGWNCRSLFGVALYREPKSKVFVLQATMRCLRAVGEVQHTGQVYLTDDNLQILNEELQQNFRISADELQKIASDRENVRIRVTEPPVKIKLKRVRKSYDLHEKPIKPGFSVGLFRAEKEKWQEQTKGYHIIHTVQEGLNTVDATRSAPAQTIDITERRQKITFSNLSLVAEIARYLNRSPIQIEDVLANTSEGLDEILECVNEFNELLYDVVIPNLFTALYGLTAKEKTEEHEIELIKLPPIDKGYYEVTAKKNMIVRKSDPAIQAYKDKTFHLDAYCFDSNPEKTLFWDLLYEGKVKKVYFTGMLTHGQSDFYIQYIDPESHTVRSYYPDFLFLTEEDGQDKYVIVEVKADYQMDDPVVQAKKEFARQVAVASGMDYRIIAASEAEKRHYRTLF